MDGIKFVFIRDTIIRVDFIRKIKLDNTMIVITYTDNTKEIYNYATFDVARSEFNTISEKLTSEK